jgi:hypothetical protein
MLLNMQRLFFNFTTSFSFSLCSSPSQLKMQAGGLIRGGKTSEAWDSSKI